MTETELKQIYSVFTDAWRFYKKYSEPVGDDGFWNVAAEECREIAKKHDNSRFSISLINTVFTEIEQLYKDAGGKENDK